MNIFTLDVCSFAEWLPCIWDNWQVRMYRLHLILFKLPVLIMSADLYIICMISAKLTRSWTIDLFFFVNVKHVVSCHSDEKRTCGFSEDKQDASRSMYIHSLPLQYTMRFPAHFIDPSYTPCYSCHRRMPHKNPTPTEVAVPHSDTRWR